MRGMDQLPGSESLTVVAKMRKETKPRVEEDRRRKKIYHRPEKSNRK